MAACDAWPSTQESLIGRLRADLQGPDWDVFVGIYGSLIYGYCRRRGLQQAEAEDATQDVFLAVIKGMPTFNYDPKRGKFRGWLGTITRHAIGRRCPTESPSAEAMEVAELAVENDAVWIAEFNSHVYETALARVRPEYDDFTWHAFELVWMQDVKSAQVAARIGRSPDWVYQAKHRVLKRLVQEVTFLIDDIPGFWREGADE